MRVLVCIVAMLGIANADSAIDPFDAAHGSNARGTKLFEEGRALLKQGKEEEACVRFDESWRIERALGTQLNLANCREHQGKLVEAYELFDGAAMQAAAQHDDMRAEFAAKRANELQKQLAMVTINLATPVAKGTIVTIDGEVVPTQPVITRHVDPRTFVVAATGPTGVLSSATLALTPGGGAIVAVPTLEERPRHIKWTRPIVGALILAFGIVAAAELDPWVGAVPIGIGILTIATTQTTRGSVVAPPQVRPGPAGY